MDLMHRESFPVNGVFVHNRESFPPRKFCRIRYFLHQNFAVYGTQQIHCVFIIMNITISAVVMEEFSLLLNPIVCKYKVFTKPVTNRHRHNNNYLPGTISLTYIAFSKNDERIGIHTANSS